MFSYRRWGRKGAEWVLRRPKEELQMVALRLSQIDVGRLFGDLDCIV